MRIDPDITKTYILDLISQEAIFESFLNIKVDLDTKIKSPFRNNDKNESCSFKYNSNGTLKLKDFGGQVNCDCFELVGLLHSINCNHKQGFMLILNIIAKHFNLIEGTNLEKRIENNVVVSVKKVITPVITDFNSVDFKYWKRGNLHAKDLKASRIYKCKLVFIDNELIYTESISNPAYLYVFTKKDFRIYFPYSKKNKFICTSNCVQGIDLLPEKQEFVVINKSFKDARSLSTFFIEGKNIESFGLGSENSLLSREGYEYLKARYKYIFTLFDNDPTGLHASWVHRKTYGTIPLIIKTPTWNSGVKHKVKDFWDLVDTLKVEETQKMIDLQYIKLKEKYVK